MGVALYVALEREIPGFDPASVSGKSLAKAQAKLDGVAKRNGLTPLSDFVSTNPEEVADFLEGEGGVPEGLDIPAEQWFEPSAGLKTVRALLEHVRPDSSAQGIRDDLEAVERVLVAAAERGVRFHLAVDF